jgi:hypothetical protein
MGCIDGTVVAYGTFHSGSPSKNDGYMGIYVYPTRHVVVRTFGDDDDDVVDDDDGIIEWEILWWAWWFVVVVVLV